MIVRTSLAFLILACVLGCSKSDDPEAASNATPSPAASVAAGGKGQPRGMVPNLNPNLDPNKIIGSKIR
jgi:hypothetical protein